MNTSQTFGKSEWDNYACDYQSLLHLGPYRELLTLVSAAVAPEVNQRVLDAGCGTGNLLDTLQKTDIPLTLVGLDRSETMIALAKQTCSTGSYILGTLDNPLPFTSRTFHRVVSCNALYTVKDPLFTLQELARVLTPGGRLVIANPKKGFNNGLILKEHAGCIKPDEYWMSIHTSPERERALVYEAIGDTKVAEAMLRVAEANRAIAHTDFHFLSEVELHRLISATGLTVESVKLVYAGQNLLITATKKD